MVYNSWLLELIVKKASYINKLFRTSFLSKRFDHAKLSKYYFNFHFSQKRFFSSYKSILTFSLIRVAFFLGVFFCFSLLKIVDNEYSPRKL